MAPKKSDAQTRSDHLRLTIPRSRAEQILDRHRGEGQTLLAESDQVVTEEHHDEWENCRRRWVDLTAQALRSSFSDEEPAREFQRAANPPMIIGGAGVAQEFEWSKERLSRAENKLLAIRERLEYLEAPGDSGAAPIDAGPLASSESKVFIVHGHANDIKEAVTRLLEKTGAHEAVILHEQPNEGRTLIEKFEDFARASDYAVVLLTADDVGGPAPNDDGPPTLHSRARQNVVFELGFFIGRLGRSRVAVLFEPDVEVPSDFKGVVYIALGDDAWRYKLLLELRNAGLEFDLNKLPA